MNENIEGQTGTGVVRVVRRRFLYWLLGFSAVSTLSGVLFPIAGYLWPPARASSSQGGRKLVGQVNDFPLNSGTVVSVGDKPVMIVKTEAGAIKAFSAICTHLGCVTYWHEQRGVIQCPCHDGRFNPVNGSVIMGPPPRPLPPYEVAIEGDRVYVGVAREATRISPSSWGVGVG